MCFSFLEFRSSDKEKSHLLTTPPLWGQVALLTSACREAPRRMVSELGVGAVLAVGVRTGWGWATRRLLMVTEV